MKKLVFVAALLLSLVGAASQASADPLLWDTGGVSWEDGSGGSPEGISWE